MIPNHQLNFETIRETIDPVDRLQYERIDRHYRVVQILLTLIGYLCLGGMACFLMLIDNYIWWLLAECIVIACMVINLIIVRKAWMFKGYALRQRDLSFRSGVILPTVTTIPYDRMQQVSVKQNPVSRIFRLYSVEVVNGAQAMSSLTIPGLTEERANQIKNIVIERMGYGHD